MHAWLAALGLAMLGACEAPVPDTPAEPPAPPQKSEPAEAPVPVARSALSYELQRYYARVQSDLLAQGLLRTDGGGADTPFSQHNLVENFVRIALYDEYVARAGVLVPEQTESQLRRWGGPVRFRAVFGETVEAGQRAQDSAALTDYASRLRRASGHPIGVTGGNNANFYVLFLHEDERRQFGPQLRTMVPGISDTVLRTIETMPRQTFCLVFAFSRGNDPSYSQAVAVIRAEHPDLLRLSCLHEELAQGLGLANDSPVARPSLFNDDEEFALLTTQDELMLKILYDSRLSPGMTATQARPIVDEIAGELMGGES
ncbi:DUF2927 domain-containing protein [Tropicimonas sp.]|uniref:DUF2927 domain-containing protein n=1 Tax=Tropicimonas sp. TaxID=2067044 RepID=UPI003A8B8DA1